MTEAEAYCKGWEVTMSGYDCRYPLMLPTALQPPADARLSDAWHAGASDAFDAEDDDDCDPNGAGYYA